VKVGDVRALVFDGGALYLLLEELPRERRAARRFKALTLHVADWLHLPADGRVQDFDMAWLERFTVPWEESERSRRIA